MLANKQNLNKTNPSQRFTDVVYSTSDLYAVNAESVYDVRGVDWIVVVAMSDKDIYSDFDPKSITDNFQQRNPATLTFIGSGIVVAVTVLVMLGLSYNLNVKVCVRVGVGVRPNVGHLPLVWPPHSGPCSGRATGVLCSRPRRRALGSTDWRSSRVMSVTWSGAFCGATFSRTPAGR